MKQYISLLATLIVLFTSCKSHIKPLNQVDVDNENKMAEAAEFENLQHKKYQDSLTGANKSNKKLSFYKEIQKRNEQEKFKNIIAKINQFQYKKSIIDSAKKFLGTPYRYGGMNSNGIDCSAFTMISFRKNNFELPRTSASQSTFGNKIKKKNADLADLIFFKTSRRRSISHVGIIVENQNGIIKFIHASTSNGVMISSLDENYFRKRFVKIKRVIN